MWNNGIALVALRRDRSIRCMQHGQPSQSQKLASLATLAAGVAHEIRNPLCASSSAAQFLKDEPADPEFRRECIEKVIEGIRRASLVIEDLLRFAHPGTEVSMAPLDLVPVVCEAVALATQRASMQEVRIELGVPEHAVLVSGVSALLQQSVTSLILLGVAAMPDGGVLRVDLEQACGEAHLRVRDTGPGIQAEKITNMFDPFSTRSTSAKEPGWSWPFAIRSFDSTWALSR